jgi:hypothetical protein
MALGLFLTFLGEKYMATTLFISGSLAAFFMVAVCYKVLNSKI